MAKQPENNVTWGTLEELLLACAVNRYGTNCWDSVAKEIQKRTSTFPLLTPQNCKQKYHDIKRRFTAQSDGGATHAPPIDAEGADADTSIWLDELRRLRIAELKRELQRFDVSIVSLQLKVKKLKEEREQSLKENQREESDLQEKSQEREREKEEEEEEKGKENIPETLSPESGIVKGVSGGESDRENQSINESNSTDHKSGSLDDRLDGTKKEHAVAVVGQPDLIKGTEKPASEASYDGSSDTITPGKKSAGSQDRISARGESLKQRIDSPEFIESVAESKGREEDGTKESSDVQSTASLSRKLGRVQGVPSSSSGGDEPGAENQSPVVKSSNGKSQPLIDFLELIRSNKHGSMFERRLETQESAEYRSIIRQHVDLATIRARLDEGQYSDCHAKFYRDLLLLVNNVAVYFSRRSSEHKAAVELRQLITKRLPHSQKGTASPSPRPPTAHPPKEQPESEPPSDSILLKPTLSGGPVVACRKRSSIAAKSSEGERKRDAALSSINDDKEKKKDREQDKDKEKAVVDVMLPEKSSFSAVTKKRTRDQRLIGSRNSSKNSGGNSNNNNNSKRRVSDPPSNKNPDCTGTDISSEVKSEKKNSSSNGTTNASNAKKQSAANFLKRIRRSSSSSNNGSLLDSLKNGTGASGESSVGAEGKKNGGRGGGGGGGGGNSSGGRSEATKDQNSSRKVSVSKQVKKKEKDERARGSAAARKNAGRPPKRVAAMAAVGKRKRDGGGEVETLPKKRGRK